jgi:uncharacterized phage protein (TIGR02218 family)
MTRSIPIQLQSHLFGGATTICALVKITPVQPGYAEYGVTTHDADVLYDGMNYLAAIGTEPSTLVASSDLSVAGGESKQLMPVFDTPVSEADMVAGAYDFAKFVIYLVNYRDLTPGRHILLQTGTLGRNTITDSGLSWVTELRGMTQRLKQSITEKWSLTCRATFGSVPIGTGAPGKKEERFPCNFDTDPLWEAGTVDAVGADTTQLFATSGLYPLADGDAPFSGALTGVPGVVKWLTGRNAGRSDETETFINVNGDGTEQAIGLTFGAMFPIEIGDTFEWRPDCPKTITGCKARGNWPNFRGESSIPVSDNGALTAGAVGGWFGSIANEVGP